MPNLLPIERQVTVISAPAEGSGILEIERITGVHRDTIMRLGVRVGQGCAELLDSKMRALPCRHLQFDEVWGFIGKKERHFRQDDGPTLGDVWTFCAIDPDTKLVPSFKVGERNSGPRMPLLRTWRAGWQTEFRFPATRSGKYVEAIELVDFAQIIKTCTHYDSIIAERKLSKNCGK